MIVDVPKADEHGWVPTLNHMGYMSSSFDPYTQKFLDFCEKNPGVTVFEGGAAYGQVTLAALQHGAQVVANDREEQHLTLLQSRVPAAFRSALTLCPGALPEMVSFPSCRFDAILCGRMLHFLKGPQIQQCFKQFFSWLKPQGKLFVIAETPYLKCYSDFITVYEARKKNKEPWPGLIEDTTPFSHIRYNNIPGFLNFLDETLLTTLSEEAGFKVERVSTIDRHDFPEELRLDGRESVGLIALKP